MKVLAKFFVHWWFFGTSKTFFGYCRFGNFRENLIFANIREFAASQIQSPRQY